MQRLMVVLGLVVIGAVPALAQEQNPAGPAVKSPLLDEGMLQKVRQPLEKIFQFTIDGDNLKADRKSWGTVATEATKEGPGGRRNAYPIEGLFQKIQSAAGASSSGMSVGGRNREITFSGDKMSGILHLRGDHVRLNLEEAQAPQRTLEFSEDGQGGFRLLVMHPDGDMILLNQGRKGAFTAVALLGGKQFAGRADTFVAFFRQHRAEMEGQILPVLAALGVAPVLAPSAPRVRQAVLALVLRTPETLAEGRQLLADLDNDKMVVREKATRLLGERYEVHKDLIQEKIKEKGLPLEVQKRLQQIVASQTDSARAGQVIAALNLTQDPGYLVSLLDVAAPDQLPRLTGRLEQLTGQKLGTDPAAWKAWAKKGRQ